MSDLPEFLNDLDAFLENHEDADQPTGAPHPIPNEAMKLRGQLHVLGRLLASDIADAADIVAGENRHLAQVLSQHAVALGDIERF